MLTWQRIQFLELSKLLILKLMRQDSDSQSFLSATDSQEDKKLTIQKKRIIRKQRNMAKDAQKHQLGPKLTKEERARIQKQKNREAAQRSRDLHKEYVTSLERQIMQLKAQLETSKRYCSKCNGALDNFTEDFFNSEPSFVDNRYESQKYIFQENNCEHNHNIMEQNQQFMRVEQPQSSTSFIKMLLLVCMIAIAVVIGVSHSGDIVETQRVLMQNYQTPKPLQSVLPVSSGEIESWSNSNGLVQINKSVDNPMCLDSLMDVKQRKLEKSLRSIHDQDIYQRHEGILICSLRTPKVYKILPEKVESPLVKIFVLGSQIKEVLSQSGSLFRLLDSNIQLNGIYRLDAEIKNVDLVNHHNCLL